MSLTWSYSSLNLFKQCPRKYHRLRVVKDIVEPQTEAITYGNEVHKVAEMYGKKREPIPKKFDFMQPILDTLLKAEGEFLFEHKMGLKSDLTPCDFFAKDVWWRGIADVLVLRPSTQEALIVDYKTGKSAKYADSDQLKLLALAVFSHFPEIEEVTAGLLFVVSQEFLDVTINRCDSTIIWQPFLRTVGMLESCMENDVWNPTQNFTCKNYCPVTDCEFNGRR